MASYSVTQFRANLSKALETSAVEAVFIESHHKVQGVLISEAFFDELMEIYETAQDIRAIENARVDNSPNIPWEDVKREWGLA